MHDTENDVDLDQPGRADADDGLIRALPGTLASKIAAGEVVQRPANALKELVENALDSGASSIDVTLQRAGSDLIQVTDDGCGMGPRDALAAFGRHATSKLRSFADLEALRTLGFRGEALASIASVSRVELTTKRHQDGAATRVKVYGGNVESVAPCAAPEGTTIAVRTLFFNVPARRSFLKTPATEFKHLVEIFQALALSHPEVAFSLAHDDTEVYRFPAADSMDARLAQLHGEELVGDLIPLAETTSYLSVTGVVGTASVARRSRGFQYVFVNGRYVRSRQLDHAVASAYGQLLPDGRFPLSAIYLQVDPRHIDVNVHPTKTEIKFDDDSGVYAFVRSVAKKALASSGAGLDFSQASAIAARPPRFSPDSFRAEEAAAPSYGDGSGSSYAPSHFVGAYDPSSGLSVETDDAPSPFEFETFETTRTGPIPSRSSAPPNAADLDPERDPATEWPIWQLHSRYLLAPVKSGLLIVDQQAAHERILYERALSSIAGGMAASQQLLFPIKVELAPADREIMREVEPIVRALGFDLTIPAGSAPVLVRGIPAGISVGDEQDLLADVLAQYRRNATDLRLSITDNLARSLARRSAVKPGDALGPQAARMMVDQLFACEEPFAAPDGRPTMVRFSEDELDQRFQR